MRDVLERTAGMGGMKESEVREVAAYYNRQGAIADKDCDTALASGLVASHALHGTSLTVDDLTSAEKAELGQFCSNTVKKSGYLGRTIIHSLAIALRDAIKKTTNIQTICRHRAIYMTIFQLFIEYVAIWDWGYTERLVEMRARFRRAHLPIY